MKKNRRTAALLLVLLILPSAAVAIRTGNPVPDDERSMSVWDYPQQDGGSDSRLFQYRSMWLEGYQIINHSEVQKVVRVARDSNINCVTPLINAHYLGTFYNSSYHPRYRDLAWDFDPTMDLLREAHKYNIKVMPWFHTMIDSYAIRKHPEWGQVTSTGARSGAWLNPTLPAVQKYLANVTYQLFRDYPLDGIQLDAIRYPSSSYGYDDYSIQQYNAEGWTDFNAFRRQQMTEVTTAIYNAISSIRPYVWIGADIGASSSGRQNSWFQDTEKWSQMGIIDFVVPMIYTTNGNSLEGTLRENINSHSCPVVCGNYVYVPEDPYYGTVPDEETGIAILQNQTGRAINAGALGTCFFAYKFLADHPNYHRALRDGVFREKALCPLKNQTIPVRRTEWWFDGDQDREGWRTTGTGNFYPIGGFWSVVNTRNPAFMSPLLNISAEGTNLVEISFRAGSPSGNFTIYWSRNTTSFADIDSRRVKIKGNEDWNLYSIHLDDIERWKGRIGYIRIVFDFPDSTNITIDYIRVSWVPYCIRGWGYIGPFYSGEKEELLDRDFLGGEAEAIPRIGDVAFGREWRRYGMERDQVDLRFVLGRVKDAASYAHIYMRSESERVAEMRSGNSDGLKVWLNGEQVFVHREPRRSQPDQDITLVRIHKGINSLLLKLAVYKDENAFFMRFTGPDNETLTGLEYFDQLPLMDPPVVIQPQEEWIGSSTIDIEWTAPNDSAALDHYEMSVDGSPYSVTEGSPLTLEGLSDGKHILKMRCVDNLGFPGMEAVLPIDIDTKRPEISTPIPGHPISTEPRISWTWKILYEPISGIRHYLVTVENWAPGSSYRYTTVSDDVIYSPEYMLEGRMKEGYYYDISVKAVSGSGLVQVVVSEEDVLVDLTPPSAPSMLDMTLVENGTREYLLTWSRSVEDVSDGITLYEIWWKLDGLDWELCKTSVDTIYSVERPCGYSLKVKVRALDISGRYSAFSTEYSLPNEPPIPRMNIPCNVTAGAPVVLKPIDPVDIDGEVVSFGWYLNGELVSTDSKLTITLTRGYHVVKLVAVDDIGATGETTIFMDVTGSWSGEYGGSVIDWLTDTSVVNVVDPPVEVPHYNNNTIVLEDMNSSKTVRTRGDVLSDMISYALVISLTLILLIFSGNLAVRSIGSRRKKKREADEKEVNLQPEEDRERLMEALHSRLAARNDPDRRTWAVKPFMAPPRAGNNLFHGMSQVNPSPVMVMDEGPEDIIFDEDLEDPVDPDEGYPGDPEGDIEEFEYMDEDEVVEVGPDGIEEWGAEEMELLDEDEVEEEAVL